MHSMSDKLKDTAIPMNHAAPPGVLIGEALRHVLDVELARSRRYERPFVLLKVALEECGLDEVSQGRMVRKVAGAVRTSTRWADTVGRSDDGTLLVILRETDLPGADAVIEKMSRRISEALKEERAPAVQILKSTWRKGDDLDAMTSRFR